MENRPFIDRENELAFLEEKWAEAGPQLIILWGKRRVGKTELIKQFIKDKPHIYFLGESTSDQEQLRKFSLALARFFKEPLLETRGFAGWEEAFHYLQKKNERCVLAVDEFPYLIISNPATPGLFQKGWDEHLVKGPVFLILLGSSIAMMENEVMGHRSPLYGRRTGQWRVDPMPFDRAGLFRKGKAFEDRLSHYAVAGGVPAYWLQFSQGSGFWQNLKDRVLKKGQPLYDEAEFILREELREPRYYFALLQAIAMGKRKLSEIVNATGIVQPSANKYLGVLADLRVVERELPVTEEKPLKSKKGLYRIIDGFFEFWFRYVFPRRGDLEMGRIDEVLQEIRQGWSGHLSFVYEQVAREILNACRSAIFPFLVVGRWWDRNDEIDVVALNWDLNAILFGEVKWSERPVGVDVYEDLRKKAQKVEWGKGGRMTGGRGKKGATGKIRSGERKEYYCLFSKSGFTAAMRKRAKEDGVYLFQEDRLL